MIPLHIRDFKSIVLFDKQIEFFDKLMPVLHAVNCYVTKLEVWSGEAGKAAGKQLKRALKKKACFKALQELFDQYYVYIPEDLSNQVDQLYFRGLELANNPREQEVKSCLELLFCLRDNIRKHIQST